MDAWPAYVKYPLAALGAYCLIGAMVIRHGWAMTLTVLLWPVVFNLIVPPSRPETPANPPPDSDY